MVITTTATSAFQRIFLDLMGPLPTDIQDNKYILTIQCDLTKFVEGYVLPDKEAKTVAKSFIHNFVLRYGVPSEVVTDQGTEFLSEIFKESCKLLDICQLNSTAHHHQTLGALENSHKSLGSYLRMQVSKDPNNWGDWIPYWIFSYNNTVNTATRYTPFELVFGRLGRLPTNTESIDPVYNFDDYPNELKFRLQTAWNDARNNLLDEKLKRKGYYDKGCKKTIFEVGDLVLLKNSNIRNKLEPLFIGPYSVVKDNDCDLVISVNNRHKKVHKNLVKPYYN